MPHHLKTPAVTLMITGFLLIVLTSCDFRNQGKSDAVIEIDLSKPGKPLLPNVYGAFIDDINRAAVPKGRSGTGDLKTALGVAASMIGLERNAGSAKVAYDTLASVNPDNRKLNQGMIVYSSTQSYKTPTYYAVKMFSENRPDKVMPTKVIMRTAGTTGAERKNKQEQDLALNEQLLPAIIATAGIHDKSGLVIVKMVNSFNTPQNCRIVLNYKQQIKYKGEVIVMTSGNIRDVNSFKEPEKVVPMTREVNGLRNTFTYSCPANSIVIILLRYKKGINGMRNCC